MTDPVFFKHGAGLTVGEIAALTGAEPRDGADLERRIYGVAALDIAGPHDLVFCDKPRFAATLAESDAGACITTAPLEAHVPPYIAALRSRDPHGAFIAVTKALFPTSLRPPSAFGATGIAEGAIVHATARLESGVTVEPGAVIGPRVEIGFDTVIASGAVIAADVRIGRGCSIGACVSIMCAFVGDRVIIHPGVRIGNDGFGYLPGAKHRKIPQLGRVIIQDDVEIGANAMIDRGSIRDTVIGEGTKIDNAVQIAHNVQIGRHCILAAQIGISGSAVIGDYVMMGGQVGVADHFTIGEGAIVAAQSGVMSDIPAGQRWGGYPARPLREWLRHAATQRNVARAGGRDVPSLGEGERK